MKVHYIMSAPGPLPTAPPRRTAVECVHAYAAESKQRHNIVLVFLGSVLVDNRLNLCDYTASLI